MEGMDYQAVEFTAQMMIAFLGSMSIVLMVGGRIIEYLERQEEKERQVRSLEAMRRVREGGQR